MPFRSTTSSAAGAILVPALLLCASPVGAAEPRLVPPAEGPEVNTLGVESDGTRRVIAYGMRARAHPDGTMDVARQLFPLARNVQMLELPARFGRGLLFWVVASGRTKIWRAPHFTGELKPFAALDFEVENVVPGFDRVYFQSRRKEWVALDADSGSGMPRGSLPASPTLGAMAFADEWFGAVEIPVRGVVVSFDAGQGWHALGRNVQLLGVQESSLLLATPEGRRRLFADGSLRSLETVNVTLQEDSVRRRIPEGPIGVAPLITATLHGFPDAGDAVVVARGALARVSLADGRVLTSRADLVPRTSECSALRLGPGWGFACQEPSGRTSVYAFEKPFGLRLEQQFASLRRLISSGNGGYVVLGGCGDASKTQSACVRTPAGARFEVTLNGNERVVASRSGEAALITPPSARAPGSIRWVSENTSQPARPLKLEGSEFYAKSVLKGGFWLDAWVETADGQLSGWIASRNEFAGVRITREGSARAGMVRRGIERALLAGERALMVPAAGLAEQSVDGGVTFTRVDLPPELQLEAMKPRAGARPLAQGCGELGCSFAGWLRVGWSANQDNTELALAAEPEPARFPSPGGARWILHCAPSGDASRPAEASGREPGENEARWTAFFEQPAPRRAPGEFGYQNGTEDLSAYLWGRAADLGKSGRFLVAAVDPYRTRGGLWTTLASPSPWADATTAAEAFSYEGAAAATWNAAFDPDKRAGVLSISVHGETQLFAIGENQRTSQLLENAARQGLGPVLDAVRVGSSYYLRTQDEQRAFRLVHVENGDARLIGQYSDLTQGWGVSPALVRSVRGDAIGVWARGGGWYVFPVDKDSGDVAPALTVSARDLSRLPRICGPDEDGYLLEGSIGIEPYVDFVEGAEHVAAHRFEGRFILGANGLCVSGLTALADAAIDVRRAPRQAKLEKSVATVSLVVIDRAERGKRWGFRCSD